ncbi:hypothetical protein, partial [Pseudomonas sp. RA_35y_Pfl2_P32]|uniref:hypothetical protein n=1 Tax=Pseudomonas sp. RA_35y_Pfl2_P32 TaxID=3088705 RepID=UPI0030DB434D
GPVVKLPGWAFGALTGVLAVALGALIEGVFVHPWPEVLHNLSIKTAIMVPVFALTYHFLFGRQRGH